MNNELEYNYIHNEINANNQIRGVLQNQIATLLNFAHQQRQFLTQLDERDKQLNLRLQAIGDKNKMLIKYSDIENW